MKILLAYDGSACSEAAIDDLSAAGLPATGEATAFSVAEVWLPPTEGLDPTLSDSKIEKLVAHHRSKGVALQNEAKEMAERAAERIKNVLPGWQVGSRTSYGSPAWETLSAAEEGSVDLIVVGSHGQSALSRVLLGSISQKVISEARCSVRVARGRNQTDPAPNRIVIGFDSTKGAAAAVDAVANRTWPEGSEVRLLSIVQNVTPTLVGNLIPPVVSAINEIGADEMDVLGELAEAALEKLSAAGLKAEFQTETGNPRSMIVDIAKDWNADSIFVGANAFAGALERFLIGSTSASVAARANCSVEVVRSKG